MSIASSAAYIAATEIQGLLVLNIENYVFARWHGTLIYWVINLIVMMVNILGIRVFPHIETFAFIHHICFFFIFLVPLVYLSPQSTTTFVFTNFENASGWSSNGVSWGIGLLASAWAFVGWYTRRISLVLMADGGLGIDGTSHMSMITRLHSGRFAYKATGEEVKNSANVVPQSMIIAFFISGALAFGASVAILFSVGDVYQILSTSTNYPIIQIFYTATKSKGVTTALVVGLMLTSVFSSFGLLASASRLTWAFARDRGFPYSTYLAHVSTGLAGPESRY